MALSSDTQQALKSRLEQHYRNLCQEIERELAASEDSSYRELAGQVHDAGESSVADLLEGINLAHLDRHRDELRQVDRALAAIAAGSYGQCEGCGGEIERDRLEAVPWAARCLECQQLWERQHDLVSDHGREI